MVWTFTYRKVFTVTMDLVEHQVHSARWGGVPQPATRPMFAIAFTMLPVINMGFVALATQRAQLTKHVRRGKNNQVII